MSDQDGGDLWLTAREARARAGMSRYQFLTLAKHRGHLLTRQQFPGCRVRYLASDVDRLVAASIVPATAEAAKK